VPSRSLIPGALPYCGSVLEDRHRAALALSAFAQLPEETQAALVRGAVFMDVPAGGTFMRLGGPHFASVVVEGLVRTFLVSPEGRELTVRYTRPGDVNGVAALYARPLVNISQQAITDSRVLMLHSEAVLGVAGRDPGVAHLLLCDLADRVSSYIHALASTTLSPLQENVVRHLLDIASLDPDGRLIARLTQEELAKNVGSVREVVGRILRDLKDDGLLLTGRDEIVLLDAERLHDRTWPRAW
jgi:CRP/FNR family cyclic AMP-dependent transcriptional regulator